MTVEHKFTKSFEGVNRSFWIIPKDSILNETVNFFPLILSGYFKNDLDSCREHKKIDPYFSSHTIENYLDSSSERALNLLLNLIYDKRKKIESITKVWQNGRKEETTIYATAVEGVFCSCRFNITGVNRSGYSDLLYIPHAKINSDAEFWLTMEGKLIAKVDFSNYNFKYQILYNTFPQWKRYNK